MFLHFLQSNKNFTTLSITHIRILAGFNISSAEGSEHILTFTLCPSYPGHRPCDLSQSLFVLNDVWLHCTL